DGAVVPPRRVEVVVVRRQPGLVQPPGLLVGQHAQGDARLHAQLAHRPDHLQYPVELRPVARPAPGRPHAEACRPQGAGLLRPPPAPPGAAPAPAPTQTGSPPGAGARPPRRCTSATPSSGVARTEVSWWALCEQ